MSKLFHIAISVVGLLSAPLAAQTSIPFDAKALPGPLKVNEYKWGKAGTITLVSREDSLSVRAKRSFEGGEEQYVLFFIDGKPKVVEYSLLSPIVDEAQNEILGKALKKYEVWEIKDDADLDKYKIRDLLNYMLTLDKEDK
ncbi:hypothetical protein Rhal01_03714 [Rubritalea halochordaticola]|uniref:Uncharacterized protein n=1 Tax=Rubritalea halochordaticola TaxID=714537 RepID=A0ABP9V4P7_9BACT